MCRTVKLVNVYGVAFFFQNAKPVCGTREIICK